MASTRSKQTIQKYNALLKDNIIKVVSWETNSVILNNGNALKEKEIRLFRTRCSSTFLLPLIDDIYNLCDEQQRRQYIKKQKQKIARQQNIDRWLNKTEDEKQLRRKHMQKIQKLVNRSLIKYPEPWNKGKTKETDIRIAQISEQRRGQGNPMFGSRMCEDEKQRKSALIKQRIKTGEWTPAIHNSRTHWQSWYKDKKYRSSWEAMYASLNPSHQYEKIRIEYTYKNKQKIYIVDFVDEKQKVLVEIKPREHHTDEVFLVKKHAAEEWCTDNDYTFLLLSQQYFIDHFNEIDFENITIPELRQKIARIKYEVSKTNRDTKA